MELTWRQLRRRLKRSDVNGVAALVSQASERERWAVATELVAYAKAMPADRWRRGRRAKIEGSHSDERVSSPAAAVAVAAIGVLPSAAWVAALLCSKPLRAKWPVVPAALYVDVARARDVPWLGELATRLAESSGATDGY